MFGEGNIDRVSEVLMYVLMLGFLFGVIFVVVIYVNLFVLMGLVGVEGEI